VKSQKQSLSFSEPKHLKNDNTFTENKKITRRKRKRTNDHEGNSVGYLRHLESNSKIYHESSTLDSSLKHKSMRTPTEIAKKQNLPPSINIVHNDVDDELSEDPSPEEIEMTTVTNEPHSTSPTAQHIANFILNRTLLTNEDYKITPRLRDTVPERANQHEKKLSDKVALEETYRDFTYFTPMSTVRPPRKVSDVDENVLPHHQITWGKPSYLSNQSALVALVMSNLTTKSIACDSMWSDRSILELKHQIPSLLEVSICVECHLRNITNQMVLKMTQSFNDKTLRMFMGYKSSLLKREKLLHKLSDYLFDVSHAYFAWKQTEWELAHSRKGPHIINNRQKYLNAKVTPFIVSSVVKKNTDSMVRDSLFDERALKKIGGCDSPSLIMHALSIGRLAQNNISWESFAKTGIGKKMLKHHIGNAADLLARNRKLHRSGFYRDISTSHGRKKATTTNIPSKAQNSSDDSQIDIASSSSSRSCDDQSSILSTQPAKFAIPTNIPITLKRKKETSWGILLSKEESLCAVMRVKNKSQNSGSEEQNLKEGDLITSIRNELNETILISPSNMYNQQKSPKSNWFKEAIDLFKRSTVLHLEVQRVSSHVPACVM
jgi:hypothetical protein